MGQCGCGEQTSDRGFKQRGSILAVQVYDGCEYCDTGIMVMLYWFTHKSVFLSGVPIEKAPEPSEFGGNEGHGICFPLLGKDDLRAAAKELIRESGPISPRGDGYRNLDDWLADYGLRLLQEALRHKRKEVGA